MSAGPEPAVRVLLCDDDQILSEALVMLIEYTADMELVAPPVRSGAGAVDAVQMHRPDVVLMDVNLDGRMDGYEATRIIRSLAPSTGVVIMSGIADTQRAVTDALAAGAHDFLPKAEISGRMVDMIRSAAGAVSDPVTTAPSALP